MRSLGKDGKWTEPVATAKWALSGFAAGLDNNGTIHILCQDGTGTIVHMASDRDSWAKRSILKSKTNTEKHFQMITHEDEVYLFFVLEYTNKKMLTFQLLKNREPLGMPKAIDALVESMIPYTVCLSRSGTIYTFYTPANEEYHYPGYRYYQACNNKWSPFIPLLDLAADDEILFAQPEDNGKIHLCFQRKNDDVYQLWCCTLSKDGSKTENENVLAESSQPFCDASLIVQDHLLKVYWIDQESIWYRESCDNGLRWGDVQSYSNFEESDFSCCVLLQKNRDQSSMTTPLILPGNLDQGVHLGFIPADIQTRKEAPEHPEDLKELIMQTLQLLSGNINDLRSALQKLSKEVEQMNAIHQQLELEINKCDIKDTFLEEEIKKIKNSIMEIEEKLSRENTPSPSLSLPVDHELVKKTDNTPLMPGTGFHSITPEFLKGLKHNGNSEEEHRVT